ncbi:MAG TPA: PPOX class F420-dependent oxidoreductase [Gaiellales bacterium]|nr:PPOX class F420-dependent oxidoreductase [Gaiellales bacterium]
MSNLPTPLTALALDLLEGRNLAHLATSNSNGTIQVTPVWIAVEDGRPVFNTAEGRHKWRNILREPRVTIEVTDSANPFRYVEIRGRAEIQLDGAAEHIELLAAKYTGAPFKGFEPGIRRVKVYVTPTRVLEH